MRDFYNKYPYTDFHELNLDWIIERVKQLTEDWLETKQAWENTETDWQELYDYVHDYFDNLNVQTEINNKIDAMILDGTFQQIATPIIQAKVATDLPGVVSDQIGSTVAGQIDAVVASQIDGSVAGQIDAAVVTPVNSWLADHITQPTTPVVDTSLTISGAAADAEVTGDWLTELDDALYNKVGFQTAGLIRPAEIGYINTSGVVVPQTTGDNRYIIIENLHGNEKFMFSGSYGSSNWGLVYSIDQNDVATKLLDHPQTDTVFYTPSDCVELRCWSDTSLKDLKIEYLNDNIDQLERLNPLVDDINFNTFGINYSPEIGYIKTDGDIVRQTTGPNRYYQIQNLTGGESFTYTGSYPDSPTWGLAYSIDAYGIATELFHGAKSNYVFNVPNDCVELRCWGDTTGGADFSLIYNDCINERMDSIENNSVPQIVVPTMFSDIQDAIDYASSKYDVDTDPVIIYILNGVYTVSPKNTSPYYAINKGANKICIKGESRDGVIIRCTCTSTLQGAVLNVGGDCTIENLTIENLADASYDAGTVMSNHNPYCIHNDTPANDETNKYYTTIKNVKCLSECDTPIGAGMHTNQIQRYEDCELIYDQNAVIQEQGSLYVHGPYNAGFTPIGLEVVDCVLISNNARPALSVPNVTGTTPWADMTQVYIRNVTYSAGSSEVSLATSSSILPYSKANTNNTLNA